MTAKEKANSIVYEFQINGNLLLDYYECKSCAEIVVKFILQALKNSTDFIFEETNPKWEYWCKVKEEIEKL